MTDHNPFTGIPCQSCGVPALMLVYRLESLPLGSFALAGVGLKTVASEWPYCVCEPELGGCGEQSRGEVAVTS